MTVVLTLMLLKLNYHNNNTDKQYSLDTDMILRAQATIKHDTIKCEDSHQRVREQRSRSRASLITVLVTVFSRLVAIVGGVLRLTVLNRVLAIVGRVFHLTVLSRLVAMLAWIRRTTVIGEVLIAEETGGIICEICVFRVRSPGRFFHCNLRAIAYLRRIPSSGAREAHAAEEQVGLGKNCFFQQDPLEVASLPPESRMETRL